MWNGSKEQICRWRNIKIYEKFAIAKDVLLEEFIPYTKLGTL